MSRKNYIFKISNRKYLSFLFLLHFLREDFRENSLVIETTIIKEHHEGLNYNIFRAMYVTP